jgi:hypothetical protein
MTSKAERDAWKGYDNIQDHGKDREKYRKALKHLNRKYALSDMTRTPLDKAALGRSPTKKGQLLTNRAPRIQISTSSESSNGEDDILESIEETPNQKHQFAVLKGEKPRS